MRVQDPGGELVESPSSRPVLVERTIEDDALLQGLSRRRDRALRRQDDPVAVLPRRQPDRSQPQLPVVLGAGHEQDRRGPVPAERARGRARSSSSRRAHPEIFAWFNFHTFGGVLIRPLGHAPDSKMDQEDLAIFRQLERWMTEHTGYPTVSGHDEFLYEPDKPLHGDLSDYAYNQRGALAYVVELWDLFKRLGMERPPKFVAVLRARLARRPREARVVGPRRERGPLASGRGARSSIRSSATSRSAASIRASASGIRRPTSCRTVCRAQSAHYLRVASLAPAIAIESLDGDAARRRSHARDGDGGERRATSRR